MPLSDRRVVAIALGTCLLAVVVPTGASAYRRYRTALERAKLSHFLQDPLEPDEGWHEDPEVAEERRGAEKVDGERESDDPLRRAIAARVLWGNPTADVAERYAQLAHQESVRWAPLMPRAPGQSGPSPLALVTGPSWVSVGPTTAAFEWNAVQYSAIDAGRMSGVLVHPVDPAQVIVALSGGGLWKTFNFGAPAPTWVPMGDALPNLAIGAIDANPANFDELYVGTGDFIDGIGGQMVKTITGGSVWSAPIQLTGRDPGGNTVKAQRVLMVKVDPANPRVVLVGTDVGLFRSGDGGATYALVDLPNASGPARLEKVWTIAYTGQVGGVSRWAISGVAACDAGIRPPEVFFAVLPGSGCPSGNQGDIWTSTDGGGSWRSRMAVAGSLPSTTAGRITLAAGTPSTASPPVTVLYAQVSSEDESGGGDPMGYWRSTDSGATWSDASGQMLNPTLDPGGGRDCEGTSNLGAGQAAYNHALAVDPGDNNRVLAGGMLCAMRTSNGLSGTPGWENVSHWLPFISPFGDTNDGTLAYAHADHHRALIVRFGNTVRALLATDGGLYWSDTLFAPAPPTRTSVVFSGANEGLVTHLVYGMGSGDPAGGSPNRVVIGLQDNGTRVRDYAAAPTTFNQVNGGDGFGAAYGRNPASGAEVYWAASNAAHDYCVVPSGGNPPCSAGGSFIQKDPDITCQGAPMPDTMPFKNVYAPVLAATAPNTFLSSSDHGVFRISGSPVTNDWQSVVTSVVDVTGGSVGTNCMPSFVRFVAASQSVDGIYGVALSGGRYAVTSGCTGTTCTWTRSAVVGLDLDNSGAVDIGERTSFTSSLAFPPGPTGHPAGDVYVVTTAAPVTQDGKTPVPDQLGHIFITTNRGRSFLALHGKGTGQDLPNVPINVVRYDTADTTNQTIFVGTLIGVYRTTDGGNTWQRYGVGLPLVSITELFIGKTGGIVRVGTYGRGVWEIYPNASAERGVSGNGDWDRDLQIDFIDMAALAIRLGTSPAGTTAPYYDWSVDLTGATNAIDDADMTALLAKFGNHP